jgi:hypothetical protein
MEALSTRAELRCMTPEDVKAAWDAAAAAAVAKQGAVIDRLSRRERRTRLPALKKQLAAQASRFCGYANREARRSPPGYRDAGEALKRYSRQEITAEELCAVVNSNLEKFPAPPMRLTLTENGRLTLDDGKPMDGWRSVGELVQYGANLKLFKVCRWCDRLFYDDSDKGNRVHCKGQLCKREHRRYLQSRSRGAPKRPRKSLRSDTHGERL